MTETLDRGWVEDAKCRGEDVNLFHPVKGVGMIEIQSRAVEICNMCKVRKQCLEYSVKNMEEVGVWGGYTSRQRRYFRNRYISGEWP
jgi:WhiB family redox-sensing transcriptional regulator|tara:strand:- start:310 stop:570 length:261 start_codon:yes stop_codon:yes gene_type:complete